MPPTATSARSICRGEDMQGTSCFWRCGPCVGLVDGGSVHARRAPPLPLSAAAVDQPAFSEGFEPRHRWRCPHAHSDNNSWRCPHAHSDNNNSRQPGALRACARLGGRSATEQQPSSAPRKSCETSRPNDRGASGPFRRPRWMSASLNRLCRRLTGAHRDSKGSAELSARAETTDPPSMTTSPSVVEKGQMSALSNLAAGYAGGPSAHRTFYA
jgi:hypothetical protein